MILKTGRSSISEEWLSKSILHTFFAYFLKTLSNVFGVTKAVGGGPAAAGWEWGAAYHFTSAHYLF